MENKYVTFCFQEYQSCGYVRNNKIPSFRLSCSCTFSRYHLRFINRKVFVLFTTTCYGATPLWNQALFLHVPRTYKFTRPSVTQ
jgi:hypothetical protein